LNTLHLARGYAIETKSPVLIFKEKRRNALQARKLGVWEGFQVGDFQQGLKKMWSTLHPNSGRGKGRGILCSFIPVLLTQRTQKRNIWSMPRESNMWILYFKRDNGII
jgi:hypothetical protein